ncbi:F0F1 ATP synthase subunit gamma [Rhodococcus aerolatus]
MPAQLRELRQRIRSVNSTKKITKAQELIATSRITRAQARVEESKPYAEEITRVLTALASASSNLDHPLLTERENPTRAAVLVVTSDRGMCGAYNANVLRTAEELQQLLRDQGKEPVLYVLGQKGVSYYGFRGREVEASWTGFSQQPGYDDAAQASERMVASFLAGAEQPVMMVDFAGTSVEHSPNLRSAMTESGPSSADAPDGAEEVEVSSAGVDEIHVVYTKFESMLTQTPMARRVAPLEVAYDDDGEATPDDVELVGRAGGADYDGDDGDGDGGERSSSGSGQESGRESGHESSGKRSEGPTPNYEFEPEPEQLLAALLPKYVGTRIYAALLESAASESAARRTAMKAATDNANELVKTLSRQANQARQAQITQEISEIVGGANALSAGADVD